jgi:hypothetical protein
MLLGLQPSRLPGRAGCVELHKLVVLPSLLGMLVVASDPWPGTVDQAVAALTCVTGGRPLDAKHALASHFKNSAH